MASSDYPHDSNDDHATPRDAEFESSGALEPAFEAARAVDANATNGMPEDAEELFERVARRADTLDPSTLDKLETRLRAHLTVVPAPAVLDTRVDEAKHSLRPTRLLRFPTWAAASLAAAAVLAAVLIPMLSTSEAPTPRLVLHVVDEPIDSNFDGRAHFQIQSKRAAREDGGEGR